MERVELHAKTKYSIDHDSTIDIKNLILNCVENNERGVALVDTGNILSFYKAEKILKDLNIPDFKLVYGVELNVFDGRDVMFKVVALAKNKGISRICHLLSEYKAYDSYPPHIYLNDLLVEKENLIVGLIYDENTFDNELLHYFDYVEVNSDIHKDILKNLKKKTLVVYSNQINALSDKEELSQKVLNNYFRIKNGEFKKYKSTKEVLEEIDDEEIVITNSNKIFDMIEKFELLTDDLIFPINNTFDIDKIVYEKLNDEYQGKIPGKIKARVEKELKLIHDLKYEGYTYIFIKT